MNLRCQYDVRRFQFQLDIEECTVIFLVNYGFTAVAAGFRDVR